MAYSFYRPIVIDHSKVGSSDLASFPVAVFGTFDYLKTVANGGKVQSSNGYDIQFYSDSALTTPLTFERESWDGSTGAAAFWIKLDLSHTADTTIYLAYGDASVTTDQQNKSGVWESSFAGVYHCVDASDSTSHARHGTATGTSASSYIGGALTFADGDKISVSGTFGNPTTLTMECWANWVTGGKNSATLISLGQFEDIILNTFNPFGVEGNTAGQDIHAGDSPRDSGWHHYAITSRNGFHLLYKDGVNIASSSTLANPIYSGSTSSFGVLQDSAANNANFFGTMDEIRISSTTRSAAWILATYKNISDSAFYTIGTETHIGGTDFTASLSDTYSIVDLLHRSTQRSLLESVSPVETVLKQPAKVVTDQVAIVDLLSKMRARILAFLDSLTVTDLVTRSSYKTYASVLAIADSVSRLSGRAWNETITIAENLKRKTAKSVSSALNIVERLAKNTSKAFSNSFSINETFSALRAKMLSLVDSLNLTETITRRTGKVLQSTISVVDRAKKAISHRFSDVLSLLDLLESSRVKMLALVDSISIVDSLKKQVGKAFTTSLSLVDRVAKAFRRGLAEAISITEFFRGGKIYFLNLLDSINVVDAIALVYHRSVAIIRTFMAELLDRLWPAEEQERHFTVCKGIYRDMIQDIHKPSASVEDFRISWDQVIDSDIITASEWVVPDEMELVANSHSDSTTTARLGGGVIGKHHIVVCHATLASGQIKSQALQFIITN